MEFIFCSYLLPEFHFFLPRAQTIETTCYKPNRMCYNNLIVKTIR